MRDLAAERSLLLGVSRTDHPTAEEMVGFTDLDPALPPERREVIALHLTGCPACAHEKDLLEGAVEQPTVVTSPPRVTALWGRWAAAAAAAGVFVAAGFLAGRVPEEPARAPGLRPLTVATFLPAHRGESQVSVLTLPGPWAVTAALPFGAPATPYRAGIWTAAGEPVVAGGETSLPDREGSLHLYVEPLPAAGDYVLVLEPADPGAESWRFPFRVVAGDAASAGG